MKYIPYARQSINSGDICAVVKVLKSSWITQGPEIGKFERALAEYCGAKYVAAVSSGTAALHLACLASGLKKGDEAITSPITFVATSNSVIYTGARPVFADINYDTINIDPAQIERKITKKTRVILPVHFGGLPCDMEQIYYLAKRNGLIIIEDACHALGAKYKVSSQWVKIGSCRHSDMAVFSFHPIKNISTGEGGAIATNDKKFYERIKALRAHGIYKNAAMRRRYPWYYEMRALGFNYRITDFQCALGASQLKRLEKFLKRKHQIATRYSQFFKRLKGVEAPCISEDALSAWHLYTLKIDYDYIGISRSGLIELLKRHNIGTQVHYMPIYKQPFYRASYGINEKEYPCSERYYRRALSIPMYAGLSNTAINWILKVFGEIFKENRHAS